jgi:hypothetical protein
MKLHKKKLKGNKMKTLRENIKDYCKDRNIEFVKFYKDTNWKNSGIKPAINKFLNIEDNDLQDGFLKAVYIGIDDEFKRIIKNYNMNKIVKISVKNNIIYVM